MSHKKYCVNYTQYYCFLFLTSRIHERAKWFANQMCICVDGTANLYCAIRK